MSRGMMSAPGSETNQCQFVGLAVTPALTRRQTEVLCLAAKGLTKDEIATALGVSWATVNGHFVRIYKALSVGNLIEALLAVGWLQAPSVHYIYGRYGAIEPGQGEDDDSTQPVETMLEFSNAPSVTVTAA